MLTQAGEPKAPNTKSLFYQTKGYTKSALVVPKSKPLLASGPDALLFLHKLKSKS
jgi:hypothetical protein